MSSTPDDRKYSKTHEWHKLEDGVVSIGISRFAVDELTDITYLEIAKQDGEIKAGESFGEIESVKATSELYCGVDGAIVAVNQELVDAPGTINQDPYEKGWMIKVKVSDAAQLEGLMSAEDYVAEAG